MIQIRKTSGRAKLQRGRWFVHGPGKIGKSTFGSGWPDTLFLATERRLEHLADVQYTFCQHWQDFKEAIKELNNGKYQKHYRTICVDVVDLTYSYCIDQVCKRLGIEHQSEEGFGKGFDAVDKEFKDSFYRLLGYPYGLVFTSHSKQVEVRGKHDVVTKTISSLPERARRIILPHMGVIANICYDAIPVKKDGKTTLKECRVMSFVGTEDVEAGDGEGYLPSKIRLYRDGRETYQLIEDYYTGKRVAKGGGTPIESDGK